MNKNSIIIDIFNKNFTGAEHSMTNTKSYGKNFKESEKLYKLLKDNLTSEAHQVLKDFMSVNNALNSEDCEQNFRYGFCLAVNLFVDALNFKS